MQNRSVAGLIALSLAGFAQAQLPQTPPAAVQSLGTGCGGSGGAPTLTATMPVVGSTMQLHATNMNPNVLGSLMVGWDDQWGTYQLPVGLAGIGMNGCVLQSRPDFQSTFSTGQGSVTWNVPVPNVAVLLGVDAWSQVFFEQQGLNPAEVGTTNGLRLTLGGGAPTVMRSSVTQWGITWYFDQNYPCGQFCNGDWWVVGPVTIVGISPQSQVVNGRVINGSMINPPVTGAHGYDTGLYGSFAGGTSSYQASLNVAMNLSASNPLTVQPSSSLVSCISEADASSGWALQTAAILTVLGTAPPADAFRPPYSGTNKAVLWSESQLDYTALAQLAPAAGAPSLTSTADAFARVWLDHCPGWISEFIHPKQNMPGYYREFTSLTGTAGLLLNSNFTNAQKRDLLVRFVQVGIDHYGNILNGMRWNVNGHCNGRKFPILFAGRMLNDPAMLGAGVTYQAAYFGPGNPNNVATTFSEDGQTFYVQQTSPGVYNWGYGGYNSSHVGMPEWGNYHTENPSSDSASWTSNSYRLCCSANGWVGPCLTMRIMGMQSAWNQQAWFDYMDRYVQIEPNGSWTESWITWHSNMWHAYRAQF